MFSLNSSPPSCQLELHSSVRPSTYRNEYACAPSKLPGAWLCILGMVPSSRGKRDLRHKAALSRQRSSRRRRGGFAVGCSLGGAPPLHCASTSALQFTEADPVVEDEETNEHVGKSIVKLALPALGIVLSDPLMSLIDTGCVGQLSALQLAALGPNTLIFNFVFQVFTFLGATTCNFIASSNVRTQTRQEQRELQMKASRTLSQAVCLAAILGLAIMGLLETLAPQLLLLMGAGPDYFKLALTYLRIRALSAPAVLVLLVGQGACLGRQDAKTPLSINLVAASINLIGDLVFTLWAAWGVAGAAWATVVSQYIAVVLLFRALNGKTSEKENTSSDFSKEKSLGLSSLEPATLQIGWFGLPTLEVLGPFYNMAAALMLRCILGMTVYTLMGKVAAQVGTLPIAAHQVAMQVFWFLSYFPESLSISAQSLVARDVRGNRQRAHAVARVLLFSSVGLGLVLTAVVAIIHLFGISWLTADERVARLVISVTKQSMISELLCAVAVVVEGIAIASGDLAYLNRMQLLNLGGVLVALISTYKVGWGLPGVWWCLVLFFASRIVYHIFHITTHWHTHILGAAPSRVTAM